jgi:hypothetical protein
VLSLGIENTHDVRVCITTHGRFFCNLCLSTVFANKPDNGVILFYQLDMMVGALGYLERLESERGRVSVAFDLRTT